MHWTSSNPAGGGSSAMVELRRSTGRPARTRRWPRLGPRRPELARPREPAARRWSGTAGEGTTARGRSGKGLGRRRGGAAGPSLAPTKEGRSPSVGAATAGWKLRSTAMLELVAALCRLERAGEGRERERERVERAGELGLHLCTQAGERAQLSGGHAARAMQHAACSSSTVSALFTKFKISILPQKYV